MLSTMLPFFSLKKLLQTYKETIIPNTKVKWLFSVNDSSGAYL